MNPALTAWKRTRLHILRRDQHICQIRSPVCTRWATEVDHIIPRANGGSDHHTNLRASCGPCNNSRPELDRLPATRAWY